MNTFTLYEGQWPKNVSKTAKYAVKHIDEKWRVTVLYDLGGGLKTVAVETGDAGIAAKVNEVKKVAVGQEGGQFYINEYQHLLVPVKQSDGTVYYGAGKVETDFVFEFEGKRLTTRPVNADGLPLAPGDVWVGPRPGIPYMLTAGGNDIKYKTPALSDTDPKTVRPRTTKTVKLSEALGDPGAAASAAAAILNVRGHQGGRFYVNEHKAMFTPVDAGDGNGLNYIYCGQVDLQCWFPEPPL